MVVDIGHKNKYNLKTRSFIWNKLRYIYSLSTKLNDPFFHSILKVYRPTANLTHQDDFFYGAETASIGRASLNF